MKKLLILVITLALIVTLGACSREEKSQEKEGKMDEMGRRMPDFGQPERQADLRGLVTKLVGNELTFLKIEKPEGLGERNDEGSEDEEEKQSLATTNTMRGPGMGRMGQRPDGDAAEAMKERLKEMASGEETVVVPVGIQMLKPSTEVEGESEMIEASLVDIKSDSMITVWLDEGSSENNVAEFILIMN